MKNQIPNLSQRGKAIHGVDRRNGKEVVRHADSYSAPLLPGSTQRATLKDDCSERPIQSSKGQTCSKCKGTGIVYEGSLSHTCWKCLKEGKLNQ